MLAVTAGKSHVGAYVSVRDRRTGCGGRWMFFSAEDDKHSQGSGLGSPVLVLDKVYAEHSGFVCFLSFFFLKGCKRKFLESVLKCRQQWGGRLVISLKCLRTRCAVALSARGHPCRYLQAFTSQCKSFWDHSGIYIYIFFFLSFLLLLPTVEFSHFQRFHTWD